MKNILFLPLTLRIFKVQYSREKNKKYGGNNMRIKYRAARKIIKKKIWRDTQIKAIVSDVDRLEETIRNNWDTIGYINKEALYSANDYIDKYLNKRDKKIVALKDWIESIDILADERASFSSCLR